MPVIVKTDLEFIREPLAAAFGFMGGYLMEVWLVVCQSEDRAGLSGTGLGVQSVLWSDARVFAALTACGGNTAMLMTTQFALSRISRMAMTDPPDMIRQILPEVYAFARQAAMVPDLKATFALNALVGVDFALWQLYAAENRIESFDTLTAQFTHSFTHHHSKLGMIPLVPYGMPLEQIHDLARSGCFFFKIKLGQNPGGRNDPEEMLQADRQRILEVHAALKDYATPYTDSGRLLYYLDANGRYDSRDRLVRLLDYLDAIGALARTVILEEPFAEELRIPVHGLPVRIAGDESAHSPEDVRRLIDDLGYGAIALKPIAKTLSVTLEMLDEAASRGIPVFCADLTVNPLLSDWNKCVACRLPPLPGIRIGVMESNGAQNYLNWRCMQAFHPIPDAPWQDPENGLYRLDEAFYQTSGGILAPPLRYRELLQS